MRGRFLAPTLLAIALAITEVVTAGWDSHTERPTNAGELMTLGQRIYVEYCAECHQTDGTGWSTLYPMLAGNPIVTLHDPEPIILTVRYGQGSMMPFREKLTTEETAAVLTYIRNSWGNRAAPVSRRQIQ
jgi:alcohol dehydrogenase (quinone), cytochrome c subunit